MTHLGCDRQDEDDGGVVDGHAGNDDGSCASVA